MTQHNIDNQRVLRVLSIFRTFDGEVNHFGQGSPSVFIRLAGCSVGCDYCDTKYSWSFKRGRDLTPSEIVSTVKSLALGINKVTITGGEPLEQMGDAFITLVDSLLNAGERRFRVTIETSGTEDHSRLFTSFQYYPKFALVFDHKLQGKHEVNRKPRFDLMKFTTDRDVMKIVISDLKDFQQAESYLDSIFYYNGFKGRVFYSPDHTKYVELINYMEKRYGTLEPHVLATWILTSFKCRQYNVGLNLQLHKYVWDDDHRKEEVIGHDWSKEIIRG